MPRTHPLGPRCWKWFVLVTAMILAVQPILVAAAPESLFPSRSAEPQGAPSQFTPIGPAVTTVITPQLGGTLRSADGSITVSFPPDAVPESVTASFTPLRRWLWGASGMRVVNMFELKSIGVLSGTEVTSFARDVAITFQLSNKYNEEALAGLDLFTLGIYTYNTSANEWESLLGELSTSTPPNYTAKTRHFSIFGSQAYPVFGLNGMVLFDPQAVPVGFGMTMALAGQSDLYSGASAVELISEGVENE